MAHLNLLVLRVSQLEAAKEFYEMLGLEFQQEQHGNGPVHYSCQSGDVLLELYTASKADDVSSTTRLGFRLPSIDQTIARLRSHGVAIVVEPNDSVWGRRAVVRDPDGHAVELSAPSALGATI